MVVANARAALPLVHILGIAANQGRTIQYVAVPSLVVRPVLQALSLVRVPALLLTPQTRLVQTLGPAVVHLLHALQAMVPCVATVIIAALLVLQLIKVSAVIVAHAKALPDIIGTARTLRAVAALVLVIQALLV
jgi:hypothetical protein